jgi:hypothetical protein
MLVTGLLYVCVGSRLELALGTGARGAGCASRRFL